MTTEQIKKIINELRQRGLRYEEIAIKLNVSIDTIRRWIYRGLSPNIHHIKKIEQMAKKFKINY